KNALEKPVPIRTISINRIGPISNAASFCSDWSTICRPINALSSSNDSWKKNQSARLQKNSGDPKAPSNSFNSGRWKTSGRVRVQLMSKQPLIDQLEQALSRMLNDPNYADQSLDPAVVELLGFARDLRDLPRPDFKNALKADLERKTDMSATTVTFRPGF